MTIHRSCHLEIIWLNRIIPTLMRSSLPTKLVDTCQHQMAVQSSHFPLIPFASLGGLSLNSCYNEMFEFRHPSLSSLQQTSMHKIIPIDRVISCSFGALSTVLFWGNKLNVSRIVKEWCRIPNFVWFGQYSMQRISKPTIRPTISPVLIVSEPGIGWTVTQSASVALLSSSSNLAT